MRLKPPEINPTPQSPYGDDKLKRDSFGESLYNVLKNIEDSSVICLDAPWGEGKTAFIKMWQASLEPEIKCIYFDAYENDHSDDPFLSFISEIISLAETEFQDTKTIQDTKEKFKEKAIKVGKIILSSTVNIGLKAITAGLIDQSGIEEVKNIKNDLLKASDQVVIKHIENKINNLKEEKDSVKEFKTLLSNLGQEIKAKQEFPLLIIIDELDRCRPDFALLLLERIKHLFSVDNVSFLIVTHLEQLKNYVKTVYGSEMDAHNYLHKFFTLTTNLPKQPPNYHSGFHSGFWESLCKHHQLQNSYKLEKIILPLCQHLNVSLREIEKVCSVLTLFYAQSPKFENDPGSVVLIALIKIKHPGLYKKLLNDTYKLDELSEALKIKSLPEDEASNSIKREIIFLNYTLLPDNEIEELPEDHPIHTEYKSHENYYRRNRKNYTKNILNTMEIFKAPG